MTNKESIALFLAVMAVSVFSFFAGVRSGNKQPHTQEVCPYEGAECPNVRNLIQDYQLQYHYDTIWIYDGDRLVGSHIDNSGEGYLHGSFIDSLILADNL